MEAAPSSSNSDCCSSDEWADLTKSDYAKVIFSQLSWNRESGIIECTFSLTESVIKNPSDYIGLFKVGFENVSQCLVSKTLNEIESDNTKCIYCCFKSEELPELNGFYQFCYITHDQEVCGASTPIEVKHPRSENHLSNEYVLTEGVEGDFLMVRHGLEKRNLELLATIDRYHEDKLVLIGKIQELINEKGDTIKQLDALKHKINSDYIIIERENAAMKSELNICKRDHTNTSEELQLLRKHLETLQDKLKTYEDEKSQLESKLLWTGMERNSFAATLDCAKMDFTAKLEVVTKERDHYAASLESAEKEIKSCTAKINSFASELETLTKIKQENKRLNRECDTYNKVLRSTEEKLKKAILEKDIYVRELQSLNVLPESSKLIAKELELNDAKLMIKALEDSKLLVMEEMRDLMKRLNKAKEDLSHAKCENIALKIHYEDKIKSCLGHSLPKDDSVEEARATLGASLKETFGSLPPCGKRSDFVEKDKVTLKRLQEALKMSGVPTELLVLPYSDKKDNAINRTPQNEVEKVILQNEQLHKESDDAKDSSVIKQLVKFNEKMKKKNSDVAEMEMIMMAGLLMKKNHNELCDEDNKKMSCLLEPKFKKMCDEMCDLKSKLEEYKDDNVEKLVEIEALKQKVADLKEELKKKAINEEKTEEIEKLKLLANDWKNKYEAESAKLLTMNAWIEEYENRCAETTSDMSAFKEKLEKSKEEIMDKKREIEVLGQIMTDLKVKLNNEAASKMNALLKLRIDTPAIAECDLDKNWEELLNLVEDKLAEIYKSSEEKDAKIEKLEHEMELLRSVHKRASEDLKDKTARLVNATEVYKNLYVEKTVLSKKLKKIMRSKNVVGKSDVPVRNQTASESVNCEDSTSNSSDCDTGERVRSPSSAPSQGLKPALDIVSEVVAVKPKKSIRSKSDSSKQTSEVNEIAEIALSEKLAVLEENPQNIESPESELGCVKKDEDTIPCSMCEASFAASPLSNTPMLKHYEIEHNMDMCPLCGQLFDRSLPRQYLEFHVDTHFQSN